MGGKGSALGRTQQGPIDADKAISTFMSGNKATKRQLDQILGGLGGGAANAGAADATGSATQKGTVENGVSRAAGTGAQSGMPTTSDSGEINMTFHQINQDGAGPLTAQIDATSGGKDPAAFKEAEVTQNVPGIGIGGLSAASVQDFPVKVQMPAGMTCTGSAGGANNVCSRWSIRWLCCFCPVWCCQEACCRIQPPQAPHGPRHSRKELNWSILIHFIIFSWWSRLFSCAK